MQSTSHYHIQHSYCRWFCMLSLHSASLFVNTRPLWIHLLGAPHTASAPIPSEMTTLRPRPSEAVGRAGRHLRHDIHSNLWLKAPELPGHSDAEPDLCPRSLRRPHPHNEGAMDRTDTHNFPVPHSGSSTNRRMPPDAPHPPPSSAARQREKPQLSCNACRSRKQVVHRRASLRPACFC